MPDSFGLLCGAVGAAIRSPHRQRARFAPQAERFLNLNPWFLYQTEMQRYYNIFFSPFFFFRRDALKEQFGKEPNRVSCLAVKSALLGTRHPRKEKEAALQTVTGKPACLDGKILFFIGRRSAKKGEC